MTQVTIVTGCAGAGKTEQLLDQYWLALNRAKSERKPGTTLWLTPTRRIQKAISQQIVSKCGGACFVPNVLTFDLFAEKILEAAGRPASPISPVMKRLLLRRITGAMQDQGELRHFKSIAETTGFLDVVSGFISELKREEIWPEHFMAACDKPTSAFARRDQELGLIYARYQQHLKDQKWYDNEGRFWLARTALGEGIRGPFENVRFLAVDGFADFTQTQYEILGYFADWIPEIAIALPVESPLTRIDLFSTPHNAISRIRQNLKPHVSVCFDRLEPTVVNERPSETGASRRGWSRSIGVIADSLFTNPRFCQPSVDSNGLEVIAAIGQLGEWEAVARRIKKLLAIGTEPREGDRHSFPDFPTINVPGQNEQSHFFAGKSSQSPGCMVRPQDIVIGLRSVTEEGPRLRDYMTAAGLPVWCEAEMPFTSSSIVKAVMLLLQFEIEDWPFERLLAVLDSNFFQPNWPELRSGQATRAVASSLRRLRLHAGRELIVRALGRYASESSSTSLPRRDSVTQLARLGLPLLVRLSQCLEKLRRSYTLGDWADVLAAITDDLGWKKQTTAPLRLVSDKEPGNPDLLHNHQNNQGALLRNHQGAHTPRSPLSENESRDLDLLQRILRTAAEADQKLAGDAPPKRLTLAEFASELGDLLSHETLKPPPEPGGCIRILSVEQIRNLDVPHLFLVGLTENSFPMNRGDDCLFSESERQDFISRGIALSHRSGKHADEMFLFYSVVTRARRSLTMTYPAVNSKGQPVFPSPYVTALIKLFAPSTYSTSLKTEGRLDPVPSRDLVLTLTDLRLAAMEHARDGHPELFRAALEVDSLRRPCLNALAACDVAEHRFHQPGFTAYEGRMELSQNLEQLGRRFGLQHQFSATELESYARCPFQFWLSNVLRIGPVESPEESTDHALRGTLVHEVLAKLLAEDAMSDPNALQVRFLELMNEQLDRQKTETDLQRALVEVERSILSKWAGAFAKQQVDYGSKIDDFLKTTGSLAPEISFGSLPDTPADSPEIHPAIQFGQGPSSVMVRGRIDRVDVGSFEGHPAYVVVDYKTGQRPPSKEADLLSGRSIQLALYLLAVKRLGLIGPDAIPFQMGYWALRDTGFKHEMGKSKFQRIDSAQFDRMESVMDHLLPELAEEIRSGRFIVENEDQNCTGRCPYRTVCRVNQLRPLAESLGKFSAARSDPTAAE